MYRGSFVQFLQLFLMFSIYERAPSLTCFISEDLCLCLNLVSEMGKAFIQLRLWLVSLLDIDRKRKKKIMAQIPQIKFLKWKGWQPLIKMEEEWNTGSSRRTRILMCSESAVWGHQSTKPRFSQTHWRSKHSWSDQSNKSGFRKRKHEKAQRNTRWGGTKQNRRNQGGWSLLNWDRSDICLDGGTLQCIFRQVWLLCIWSSFYLFAIKLLQFNTNVLVFNQCALEKVRKVFQPDVTEEMLQC